MNKCRIYDEDCRAHSSHYRSVSERKRKNQFMGKPYTALVDKGKQQATNEKIQVEEELQLLLSVSSVVSRATVLMSARIMFWGSLSVVRQVTVLYIVRVMVRFVITVAKRVISLPIFRSQRKHIRDGKSLI